MLSQCEANFNYDSDSSTSTQLIEEEPQVLQEFKFIEKMPESVRSHVRRWVMITLSHLENAASVTEPTVVQRLTETFDVYRIVIGRERHADGNRHWHVLMQSANASKNNVTKKLRGLFPEFTGRGINVSYAYKGWGTPLKYVTKDGDFSVYGNYDVDQLQEDLKAVKGKRKMQIQKIRKLAEKDVPTETIMLDEEVETATFQSVDNTRNFIELVKKQTNAMKGSIAIVEDLGKDAVPYPFDMFSPEQLLALHMWTKQMTHGRKPRQPQPFLCGPSGTGKTYWFQFLASFTNAYLALPEGDRPIANYSDQEHDWIFINEFTKKFELGFLLQLTEGTPMQFKKYRAQGQKNRNCPVVFTGNCLPTYSNGPRLEALKTRLFVMNCSRSFLQQSDPTALDMDNFYCEEEEVQQHSKERFCATLLKLRELKHSDIIRMFSPMTGWVEEANLSAQQG